jgi:hypothetical protein
VNELPTIKKRRTETKPQLGERDCEEHAQSLQCSQERVDKFWSSDGEKCANVHLRQISGYKLASTLKFEQRSGNSQCQLAWNVPKIQQRVASVNDIHLQMMSDPDFNEFESESGCREERGFAWCTAGSNAKDIGVKGRERWVPLQNAKERLTLVLQNVHLPYPNANFNRALKRTSLQRDLGKASGNNSWYTNQRQQKPQQPFAKKQYRS